jgi:hypothetical protein
MFTENPSPPLRPLRKRTEIGREVGLFRKLSLYARARAYTSPPLSLISITNFKETPMTPVTMSEEAGKQAPASQPRGGGTVGDPCE